MELKLSVWGAVLVLAGSWCGGPATIATSGPQAPAAPQLKPMEPPAPAVGRGYLELGLGHLCTQAGCVEPLQRAIRAVPDVLAASIRPSDKEPRATILLRPGPIDLWAIRRDMQERGVAVRRVVLHDFASCLVFVEPRRWQSDPACAACVDRILAAAQAQPWSGQLHVTASGVTMRVSESDADLTALFDALAARGVAPARVWLVPSDVALPNLGESRMRPAAVTPKTGGSDGQPVVEFDLGGHICSRGVPPLDLVGELAWASRTAESPDRMQAFPGATLPEAGTLLVGVGDRQYADLLPMVRALRDGGRSPTAIRLRGFGDVRLHIEFSQICGAVEYSKPPQPPQKPEPKAEAAQKVAVTPVAAANLAAAAAEPKKDVPPKAETPFQPRPLRPAPSSNGRQAIERAVAGVRWISDAVYTEYHTRAEFDQPKRLMLACSVTGETVRLDELLDALERAGFPPTAVRASRLFPGIPFGQPLPADLELKTLKGERRRLAALRRPDRPLVVAFVSLNCPKWEKSKYQATPEHFGMLRSTLARWGDRADFVAISSNPNDVPAPVAEFIDKAGLPGPLLHDADDRVRAAFNAQITPSPHVFIFDAGGRLRYAGEAHDQWEKPSEKKVDYLSQALELVTAGKYLANGAVFFRSAKCNCSSPECGCPKCGCGASCRCKIGH
jgi:peroxiredoxin